MKKFVLLVVPTIENAYHRFKDFVAFSIPIGLLSIAAVLEKEGYLIEVIDADAQRLSFQEALEFTAKAGPAYIGLTTMTAIMDITENFFVEMKKKLRPVTVIAASSPFSIHQQKFFKECPELDFGSAGEGGTSFQALVLCAN